MRKYTKRYHNCLEKVVELNTCSRSLLDFLLETLDDKGQVYSSITARNRFREFIYKTSESTLNYSDSSIKKGYGFLLKSGLIEQVSRGVYRPNSTYFITGKEKEV